MSNKLKSLIFDFLQIGSLVFFLLTGPVIPSSPVLVFFQIVSILLLTFAAWEMRRTKYYRVPDVGKQNELVKSGVFIYIRNPMYLAQLLFCGVLVINSFSWVRLLVYLVYTTNFLFKIYYEENLLKMYFTEFEKYKKTSWRLIPFIY